MRERLDRYGRVLRQRWTLALAVLAVCGLIAASPALGSPEDDKAQVDRELAQATAALEFATDRAKQAGAQYAQANAQLPAAEQAVAQARGQVASSQVLADEAAKVAAAAKVKLNEAEAVLTATEEKLDDAREELSNWVRSSYQGSNQVGMTALLGAKNPQQVLDGLDYLDTLADAKKQAVTAVSKARMTAAAKRATVAERKKEADEADAAAKAALAAAQEQQRAAEEAQQRVVQLVSQREAALKVAEQEKAANQQKYENLQAESERIAEEIRAAAQREREAAERRRQEEQRRQQQQQQQNQNDDNSDDGSDDPPPSNNNGGTTSGSGFMMPVNGWKSSDFGWRFDPYYYVWQLHAGMDLAAPGGAPIWASKAGRVIYAGWNGGYGNYTCILHGSMSNGQSLTTCYAHQSSIRVSVGQSVSQGQVIGLVGTTGASTGDHLHFEIRLDGDPVNPANYL